MAVAVYSGGPSSFSHVLMSHSSELKCETDCWGAAITAAEVSANRTSPKPGRWRQQMTDTASTGFSHVIMHQWAHVTSLSYGHENAFSAMGPLHIQSAMRSS